MARVQPATTAGTPAPEGHQAAQRAPSAAPPPALRSGSRAHHLLHEVLELPRTVVDEANKAVSKAEAIRTFTILVEDWTEKGGQLTPSLKLKRSVVMKQYSGDVEKLYAGAKE